MERSIQLKLTAKEDSPDQPDDNRSTIKVKILGNPSTVHDAIMLSEEQEIPSYEEETRMDNETDAPGHSQEPPLLDTTEHKIPPPQRQACFLDKLLNRDRMMDEEDNFMIDEYDVAIGREGIFHSISLSQGSQSWRNA